MDGTTIDISQRWKGKYNTFDLKLGKPFHISRYFIFSPHIGLRFAWIDQCYLVRHSNFDTFGNPEVNYSNDYWDAGIRGELDLEFLFGKGVYLFSNLAGSILYGKFDISMEANVPLNKDLNVEREFYTNSSNLELALGLAWSKLFCKDRYRFLLRVAYEFHYWWDQNRLRKFYFNNRSLDESSRGDLSMSNFTFRAGFDL